MSNRFLLSCALLTLAASPEPEAVAQPFFTPPAPACVAPTKATQADSLLADKIAAADRSIEAGKPGAWTALADLAQYACAIVGDRLPADAAFRRCIRQCADERDVYFAHVILRADARSVRRCARRGEPVPPSASIEGQAPRRVHGVHGLREHARATRPNARRARRAEPFCGEWSYRSPTMQLKLSLMRKLGMDTQAEEEAAKQRPDTDLARMRADAPPMSAIPVERNPLAQAAFGRTIEVVGNAWIEPAAEAGAPQPGHLLYRRASMPDPRTFARSVALAPGQRFVVVVDLGTSGCRVAVDDARYDLEECPWRTGRADADLFRVVEERTPLAPPVVVRPRPPIPVGPSPQSEPAPLWAVWEEMYSAFAAFERRGEPAYSASVLEQNAGLTPAEAAQVRAAGAGYVQQLERIDADTRRQIAERFGRRSRTANVARHPGAAIRRRRS